MYRRAVLGASATVLGALAGCSGGGDDGAPTEEAAPTRSTEQSEPTTLTESPTTRSSASAPTIAVRIRYDGPWEGMVAIQREDSLEDRSIEGVGDRTIEIAGPVLLVRASVTRLDDSFETLRVQILDDGAVVDEGMTRDRDRRATAEMSSM